MGLGLASASSRPGFPGSRCTQARLRAPRLHPEATMTAGGRTWGTCGPQLSPPTCWFHWLADGETEVLGLYQLFKVTARAGISALTV